MAVHEIINILQVSKENKELYVDYKTVWDKYTPRKYDLSKLEEDIELKKEYTFILKILKFFKWLQQSKG